MPNRVGVPAARVDLDPAVVGVLPGDPLPRLRREGEFVVQRSGRLIEIQEIGAWVFVFDKTPGQADLRPMIVQRSQRLASMQDTLGQRRDASLPMIFNLTGQVHTYRGVNYLLPTAIAGTRVLPATQVHSQNDNESTTGANNADAEPPFGDPFGSDAENFQTPATFDSPTNATGADGSAMDVMEQMLDGREQAPDRPDTAPLITGAQPTIDPGLRGVRPQNPPRSESARPDAAADVLLREGAYLVNRAGRLTRSLGFFNADGSGTAQSSGAFGGGVMFTFEADGADPAASERPMMLMPCKLLEHMESTVAERGDQVVFLMSGRVHTYRGANYLLPTMVRLEPDRGNLRN